MPSCVTRIVKYSMHSVQYRFSQQPLWEYRKIITYFCSPSTADLHRNVFSAMLRTRRQVHVIHRLFSGLRACAPLK